MRFKVVHNTHDRSVLQRICASTHIEPKGKEKRDGEGRRAGYMEKLERQGTLDHAVIGWCPPDDNSKQSYDERDRLELLIDLIGF
jgi:hypothetical protein